MPEFQYQALDRAGQPTSGTIAAGSQAEAASKVRALGVFPVQVDASRAAFRAARTNAISTSGRAHRLSRVQVLLFARAMADLLDAGLPMDRAFSVLLDQTDAEAVRSLLTSLQADIRSGQPLSEGLGKFPREFPSLFVNMVRAGEVSGQLAEVMSRLASFLEKEQVRRSQVMAALTYPIVLISVALSAVTFLLTFVIPRLRDVFTELGGTLPVPTQILLAISSFIGHFWWAIIAGIVVLVLMYRAWQRTAAGRTVMDSLRLSLPLFGPLNLKMVAARLTRTLGTLLAGGVPILDALEISASALGNSVAAERLLEARGAVRQGEPLHLAVSGVGLFPPVVRHMAAVGEETGRLAPMLLRTAETLDFEIDNAMRRLTSLVEPLVVLLMGGFVGFVVLSILLPIFEANSLVK